MEKFEHQVEVTVDHGYIVIYMIEGRYEYQFDREHKAYKFIEDFDKGLIVYPNTFTFDFDGT